MSSCAIEILTYSVKHPTGSLQKEVENHKWKETTQQKVHNQEKEEKKFQALILLVYKYNTPSLIRSQEGSVSNVGCMPQFHIFLIFNSFE